MDLITYNISPQVFAMVPNYRRAVILFKNIENIDTPDEVWHMFQQTLASINTSISIEKILEQPAIVGWRQAFKSVGINPGNDRPSIEALLRRALNNPTSFKPINLAVDLGNICSLSHLLPIGIHPVFNRISNLELRFANGIETYTDFSQGTIETVKPGEIIFEDQGTVLTRKWVWRQSRESIITLETKNLFINIDFVNPDATYEVSAMRIKEMFEKHFNRASNIFWLSKSVPSVFLS